MCLRFLLLSLCISGISLSLQAQKQEGEQEREREGFSRVEREEFERLRTCDPQTGQIPAQRSTLDRQFVERFRALESSRMSIQSATPSVHFRPVGPTNVGGRTTAFAVDYSHPNIMLAGGATGGIWRSVDAGATWVRVSELSDIQNVSCIVQDPVHPNRWYCGTGEVLSTTERRTSTNLRTICTGTGIYLSNDAGVHWQRISPEFSDQPNELSNPFQGIWRLIATGDTLGDELYAACYGGVYRYRQHQFVKIAGDSLHPSFCTDIALSTQGGILYAAYSADDNGVAPDNIGIWASRDSSHTQWTQVSPEDFPIDARRICLATAPSNPKILYVFVQKPVTQDSRYVSFGSYHYLWWHQDSSAGRGKWSQRKSWLDSVQINTLGGYAMCLAVHPSDENIVYLAGTDLYRTASGFSDTTDAIHLGGYPYQVEPGVLHPDLHHLNFSQQAPYKLYTAGDGGIAYTEDPLSNTQPYWKSLNNGYNATQCYFVAQDEFVQQDSLICVSLQDNSNYVTRLPRLNVGWTFCGGGDGTCAQILAKGGTVFAGSQYANSMYAFGFDKDDQPDYMTFSSPELSNNYASPFVSSFRLIKRVGANDTILVLSVGNHLFHFDHPSQARQYQQTEDLSWKEWLDVGSTIPSSALITNMCPSKTMDGVIYLSCTNGSVYRVDASTDQVSVSRLKNLPAPGFISSIDCSSNGMIAVSISNYNTRAVFAANEVDSVWVDISDELRLNTGHQLWGPSVRCVRFYTDPVTSSTYLLTGTSVGLFACPFGTHKTGAWTGWAQNTVGSVCVESMSVRALDGRLLLATHGAGVYESIPGEDTNGVDTSSTQYFDLEQNFPNPAQFGTFIRYHTAVSAQVLLELFDSMGRRVKTIVNEYQPAGYHQVELGAEVVQSVADGIYYYKLHTPTSSASRVMSIVR